MVVAPTSTASASDPNRTGINGPSSLPRASTAPLDVVGGVTLGTWLTVGWGAGQLGPGMVEPAAHVAMPGNGTCLRPAGTSLVVNASGPGLPGKVNPPLAA